MLRIGDAMFKNQLGDIGKSRRKSRKKNKLSWLSSTWKNIKYEKITSNGRELYYVIIQ